MSSFNQKSRELIDKAERGDWTLECDEKMLELMQNVASKVETRSTMTKRNIDSMMLNLDETKVRLSNLTRISSIKNTNYCEHLIREDLLDSVEDPTPEEPVNSTDQIAIENGLKFMEQCFEMHRVNLDPSTGSETTIVYRPIDKYMNVLPHLIGSDKWNKSWHVGLLDTDDKTSQAGSTQYAESVDSNPVQSSSLQPDVEEAMIPGPSLRASQNLSNSISSFDHMVINQQGGLFDDAEHGSLLPASTSDATVSSFFRQPEQRKIVNLFDEEPPSLQPSPVASRKVENLFDDDYGSVESLPVAPTLGSIVKSQPPVDLFNDNEFDNFIRKIEQQPSASQSNAPKPEEVTAEVKKVQDIKKITDEIRSVQLKKVQQVDTTNTEKPQTIVEPSVKKVMPIVQSSKDKTVKPETTKAQLKQPESTNEIKKAEATPPLQYQQIENKPTKPRLKNITNLFDDDDDDQGDYFSQIIKQKAASKTVEPVTSKSATAKLKSTNLFDDDDDVQSADVLPRVEVVEPLLVKKTASLLFDDDEPPEIVPVKHETVKKATGSLFDDDDSDDFVEKPKVTVIARKPEIPEPPLVDEVEEKVEHIKKIQDEHRVLKVEEKHIEDVEETPLKIEESNPVNRERIESVSIDPPPVPSLDDIPALNDTISKEDPSMHHSTPSTSFNATLPFLSDEPPEDDTWDTEDQYDEQPDLVVNRNVPSYSSLPLFDDVPPEDDFMPEAKSYYNEQDEEEQCYYDETENKLLRNAHVSESKLETSKESVKETINAGVDSPTVPILEIDDSDVAPAHSSIRSKLDKLMKKAEETPELQQPKKPLPGKLNMNIKINVGALMPGARPTRSSDTVDRASDSSNSLNDSFSHTPSNNSSVDSQDNNSKLLNNDAAKTRAKIKVKRRPSTRRGRQANYQRALSDHLSEGEAEEKHDSSSERFEKFEPPSTKNLAVSVFDDMDDDEEIATSAGKQTTTNALIFDEEPPPTDPIPKEVTTNRISVFYDDEDDTRLLVEQQRRQQQSHDVTSRQNASAGLFDDLEEDSIAQLVTAASKPEAVSTSQAAKVEKPKQTGTAFYDESDNDLFGGRNSKPTAKAPLGVSTVPSSSIRTKKQETVKHKSTASLFDDDEDDDLFGTKTKTTATAVKPSKKLFESDDDDSETNNGTIIFPKKKPTQPKKQSLFGDEDSEDDDDLFSSKPKSSAIKSISSSKSSTIVKKQSTQAVDDPLKDLMNK